MRPSTLWLIAPRGGEHNADKGTAGYPLRDERRLVVRIGPSQSAFGI
jgi:hypothetical protein